MKRILEKIIDWFIFVLTFSGNVADEAKAEGIIK